MSRVAVVGCTGAVGAELLQVLAERAFPVTELRLLASARSAGTDLDTPWGTQPVREATAEALDGVDLALFSAGSDVARDLAPGAAQRGVRVVDNSSAFRMDPQCPLVVPEVNRAALADVGEGGCIVANPNCSTILLVSLLHPLHEAVGVRRVVVCSYQAASGAGARAVSELERQLDEERAGRSAPTQVFPKVLAHNVLPWVQGFRDDGFSTEEHKVRVETRRILGSDDVAVSATCVRVPVWRAHAEAVHVELCGELEPAAAETLFEGAEGIRLWKAPDYPTPREVAGTDGVHVGRIRRDAALEPGLAFWGVMDQLRKGAALNAVQIAEELLRVGASTRRTG